MKLNIPTMAQVNANEKARKEKRRQIELDKYKKAEMVNKKFEKRNKELQEQQTKLHTERMKARKRVIFEMGGEEL